MGRTSIIILCLLACIIVGLSVINTIGKHFSNLYPSKEPGRLDILRWKLFYPAEKWPKHVENTHTPQLPNSISKSQVYVTMINHATLLIQVAGLNILTDPIFSERASPFSWMGPKRVRAPGLLFKELPKIDYVLVSHSHYDHMDIPSLQQLARKDNPIFLVPLNNAPILQKNGINNVQELNWWQQFTINPHQSITLVPSHHWSQRTLFDKDRSLWGAFVISSNDLKIFFAGDSGFGEGKHFEMIKSKMNKIDLSLLPIGSYEPRWFMQYHHMNPDEAVKAHKILSATKSIGIHFGTFQLTNESYEAPVIELKNQLLKQQVPSEDFIAPNNGQTMEFTFNH
jgi:L-ascorbate metabolism protein UlaG (beta-lactamase superfamily)